jgi:copper resistance protein C
MNHRTTARRAAVIGVTAIVASLAFAAPASAHSQLLATNPTDGAAVTAPIDQVELTFNERVQGTFTTVVVSGPGSASYSDGHVQVIDDVVHQKVYPLGSGAYSVAWRAISADGHPVEGQFHFTVTLPPGEEPTAGPPKPGAATKSGGGHTYAWIGGGVAALLVVGAITTLAMRPRRHASQKDDDMVDA